MYYEIQKGLMEDHTSQSMQMKSNGGHLIELSPLILSSCMSFLIISTASFPFPHDSTIAPSRVRVAKVKRSSTELSSATKTLSPDNGVSLCPKT